MSGRARDDAADVVGVDRDGVNRGLSAGEANPPGNHRKQSGSPRAFHRRPLPHTGLAGPFIRRKLPARQLLR